MFLMFSLKRENVLPTGDFGVRMAMYRHYLDVQGARAARKVKKSRKRKVKLPTPEQMEKIAKCWELTAASHAGTCWQSIDTNNALIKAVLGTEALCSTTAIVVK